MEIFGIIGVGIQGAAIAHVLLAKRYAVHVYDVAPEQMQSSKQSGAHVHHSIESILEAASVILLILPPGRPPFNFFMEAKPYLTPSHVVIQMGTTNVKYTNEIASFTKNTSINCCEAIIAGPIATIMDGTCPFFLAGTKEQKQRVLPILNQLGEVIDVGEMGKGTLLNIAILTHLYSLIHGFSLASAIVQRSKIDLSIWKSLIEEGIGGHPGEFLVQFWLPAHLEHRSYGLIGPAQVKNETALAEIEIILEQAKHYQLDTGLISSMKRVHEQAHTKSAKRDWSSIFDQLAPQELSVSTSSTHSTSSSSTMRIESIIDQSLPILHPQSTIKEAATLFQQTNISNLPVINPIDNAFLGIVSEGEILGAQISNLETITSGPRNISEIETLFIQAVQEMKDKIISPYILRNPFCIHPSQQLFSVAVLMFEKKIQNLPVVNGTQYLGMVTRSRLLSFLLSGKV